MKKIWIPFLITILASVIVIFDPPTPAPEVSAGILTFLVVLAVIGVPILVGYIIFYWRVSPAAAKFQSAGDYAAAWLLGTCVIAPTVVIVGLIWSAVSLTYSHILTLLGG